MKYTVETYTKTLDRVHLEKYNYHFLEQKDGKTYVIYTCPIHGLKKQEIHAHKNGYGCVDCAMDSKKSKLHNIFVSSTKNFIDKARQIHGDKYDYSKVKYINCFTKICIICPEHGEFWQRPSNHIHGSGCPICGGTHGVTLKMFIDKANKKHNFKYTYKNAIYKNAHTKLLITCPEHGDFLQTPNDHLSGCGCPECKTSHMEIKTKQLLTEYNIKFEEQKQFDWLVFKKKGKMKLDFYLPDHNIAIECQGEQHFYPIEYFHGKEKFEIIKERDECKKKLCEENNVNIEYINYYDNLENKLNEILKNVGAK